MEEIKNLLSRLKATVLAEEICLNTRNGIEICSVTQRKIGNSDAAVDSTILGASEINMIRPYVIVVDLHQKKVLMGAGPKTFLSVKIMSKQPVSDETRQEIEDTAQKIAKIIK